MIRILNAIKTAFETLEIKSGKDLLKWLENSVDEQAKIDKADKVLFAFYEAIDKLKQIENIAK